MNKTKIRLLVSMVLGIISIAVAGIMIATWLFSFSFDFHAGFVLLLATAVPAIILFPHHTIFGVKKNWE